MDKEKKYGTLADSKEELQFIRILMFLGLLVGLQFGYELAESGTQTFPKDISLIFGGLGGAIAGGFLAKALSVAFQVLLILAVVAFHIYRILNLLNLIA